MPRTAPMSGHHDSRSADLRGFVRDRRIDSAKLHNGKYDCRDGRRLGETLLNSIELSGSLGEFCGIAPVSYSRNVNAEHRHADAAVPGERDRRVNGPVRGGRSVSSHKHPALVGVGWR